MSLVDFSQDATDHGCLHIAVMPLGEASGALYAALMDVLRALPPVQLQEAKGTVLFLRFLSTLPKWASDSTRWEEFTAYKQILGVLAVSQCQDLADFESVKSGFKQCSDRFKRTLCDSRCIVYGPKKALEEHTDARKGFCLIDCEVDQESFTKEDLESSVEDVSEIVCEFARSIHAILSSRIREYEKQIGGAPSQGRAELSRLRTPFDAKPEGVVDFDDREREVPGEPRHFTRNHTMARITKHLGDLYLLSGQLQQASLRYLNASQSLKSRGDFLWTGSAFEGMTATALMMKKCEDVLGQKAQGTATTLSFFGSNLFRVATSGSRLSLRPGTGSVRVGNTQPQSGDGRRRIQSERGVESLPGRSTKTVSGRRLKSPSPDQIEEVEEGGMEADGTEVHVPRQDSMNNFLDGSSDEEEGGEEGVEGVEDFDFLVDPRLLQKDFIVDKYTLAIHFYSKAGPVGGVAHMEALLKFAKYLASQKRHVLACEILQRMLKVESYITESDKIGLYQTMASVFASMNFHRKAAMLTHYAALQANNMARSTHDYYNAHNLLLQCLPGYKLSLDVDSMPKHAASHVGWPFLQARILRDFVFLARQLGENIVAIRHSCFLLQTLYIHLAEHDLKEVVEMLEDISREAQEAHETETAVVPFMQGELHSPIPLTEFPNVKSFTPQSLAPQLYPHRYPGFIPRTPDGSHGPFIYSALVAKRKKARLEVLWVQGDPAEIAMVISNPLPFELRVEKMAMLTDGVKVDAFPSSLTLPPNSEPQQFILVTIPLEPGLLNIRGYEATVFGVHSKCLVKIPGDPVVRVIPALPQLRVRVFPALKQKDNGVTGKSPSKGGKPPPNQRPTKRHESKRSSLGAVDKFELMDGEVCQCEFWLDCLQDVPIDKVKLSIKEYDKDYHEFSWKDEEIQSILPLRKNDVRGFSITIHGKVPSWLRVDNDMGVGQPTLLAYSPGIIAVPDQQKSPPNEATPKSNSFDFDVPSTLSPPVGTPSSPLARSPASSPVLRRTTKKPRTNLFAFHTIKRRSSNMIAPEMEALPIPSSSLIGSLSLEHPALFDSRITKTSHTLPSTSAKRMSIKSKEPKRTAIFFDDYDFERFSDKRASIRSEPGDEVRNQPARHRFSLKPRVVATNSVPIPKSESVAVGMTSMGDERGLFEPELDHRSTGKATSSLPRTTNRRSTPITKGNISLPTGPLRRAVPHPPQRKQVYGQFVLEYSGGEGGEEGYYRELTTRVTVNVKPSLIFGQFDVKVVDGSKDLFSLDFTVQNISKHKLSVTWSVSQDGLAKLGAETEGTLLMEPEGKNPVSISLKRFFLPDSHTLGIKNESNTTKLYCDKIVEMVHFNWRAIGVNRSGTVPLDGLRLSLSSSPIVKPVPLLFNVTLNGQPCPMQGPYIEDFHVGVPITARVILTNNSGTVMPPALLLLEPYQFSQEQKRIVRDLSGKMVHSANLFCLIPQLESGQSFKHTVTLVFLYKGTFQFDVRASTFPHNHHSLLPNIPTQPSATQTEQMNLASSTSKITRTSESSTPKTGALQMENTTTDTSSRSKFPAGGPTTGQVPPTTQDSQTVSNITNTAPVHHLGSRLVSALSPVIGESGEERNADLAIPKREVVETDSFFRALSNCENRTESVGSKLAYLAKGKIFRGPHITFHVI